MSGLHCPGTYNCPRCGSACFACSPHILETITPGSDQLVFYNPSSQAGLSFEYPMPPALPPRTEPSEFAGNLAQVQVFFPPPASSTISSNTRNYYQPLHHAGPSTSGRANPVIHASTIPGVSSHVVNDRQPPGQYLSVYRAPKNLLGFHDCFDDCSRGRFDSKGFVRRGNLLAHLREYHGQAVPRGG